MAVALQLHTCLAAKLRDGVFTEFMAVSEMVDEFVLSCEAFVAVTVGAIVLRSGLCCDVAIQGGQPHELGSASA